MKRTIYAAVLLSLIASTAALADSDKGHRRDADARHRHESRWDDRSDHRHARRDWRHERGRVHVGTYHFPRGYRHKKWRRGDRLPYGYYARPYVVHDYHGYHLHAPPRGYHWVRVNHDVVLAAIATGVVLDVLYDHFY